MIVFDDADMEPMLPVLEKALTVFAGQFCMTGSRLLVQEAVYDTVRDRLAERLRNVRVGPASDPKSDMGPLIDKPNVERVDKIVRDAVNAGAKAIVGGGPITDGPLANGAFFRPALLEVSDNSLRLCSRKPSVPSSPSSGSARPSHRARQRQRIRFVRQRLDARSGPRVAGRSGAGGGQRLRE
ncbi:aldehyde dehydrogenase family protein [Sinorhizobium meliloti]|uniref:aldehyde dehydrogenase family protein n=1 Tax=Rhizobium meliloti TaxID=382 RepID=UPI00119B8235|nr:aldehyde dehydrogenase family protein [Sinorhizobium meliloti]TWA93920.1 aldehyde dehydrogenase family protein [Ensifer sp. SEMIA 134]TWB30143.1 aldehyde dehydrogenase family protein [Ensifer sp. SEMIA 135]